MRDTEPIDVSTIAWSRLTPEQQDRLVRQIITQARAERARALRNLLWLPASLALRAAGAIAAGWRAGAQWRRRRRAIRELSAFDDRTLHDIGLDRSGIEAAVRGAMHERALPAERARVI